MSSDTESTVCDPRSEVAPEPQVPKGPGQIRRVPQLFTATARSTPVVPPQVQQNDATEEEVTRERTTRVGRPRGGMKVAARSGERLRKEIGRGRLPRVGDG